VEKKEVLIKNTKAPKVEWLDFVKGIAIICIVIGHGGDVISPSFRILFVYSFHLPIFFIISGFLFAHNNSITLSFSGIFYKRFRSLLLPYLTTGLIIFLLRYVLAFYAEVTTCYSINHNLIFSITQSIDYSYTFILNEGMQFLLDLCYGSGKNIILLQSVVRSVYVLWFLPSLFTAIIIFYFFLKLFEKYSIAIQSIIIILLTFAGYMIGKFFFLPWSIDISLVSQIFLFSGYLMRKDMIFEKKTPIWFFIAAASIWFLDLYMGRSNMNERIYNNLAISTIGAIAASFLLMKLSFFLSNSHSFYYKSISYIGRQSLVILCFHLFDVLVFFPMIIVFAEGYYFRSDHWIVLSVFHLCYSLLIAETIKLLPLLKSVYYPITSRIIEER
jgi:fucose 4-O-acetylase-like acetyltransferase